MFVWRLLISLLFVSSVADPPLHQDWVGELQIGDSKRFVQLKINADHQPVAGTIAFPASSQSEISLSDVSVDQGHVKFAWKDDADRTSFDGRLSAGLLSGTVSAGNKRGILQLAPNVTLTAEAEQRVLGYYEMRPGHIVSVLKFPLGLVYSDYISGRLGVLFPSSKDTFFAGPSFQVALPVAIRCRLSTDRVKNLIALHWQDKSGRQIGRKLDQRREEVTFKGGDVVLSGTLMLPSGKGPHTAIVRIQGSGPQTRRNAFDGWFAYHGIAYLSFDKRGTGKSTGDWRDWQVWRKGKLSCMTYFPKYEITTLPYPKWYLTTVNASRLQVLRLLCIISVRPTHFEGAMGRTALTRTNLLLETGKVRRLRKALQSRSNSEAVRRVIDERLAVEAGLQALQDLRKLGGPDDVFGRAPAKRR